MRWQSCVVRTGWHSLIVGGVDNSHHAPDNTNATPPAQTLHWKMFALVASRVLADWQGAKMAINKIEQTTLLQWASLYQVPSASG